MVAEQVVYDFFLGDVVGGSDIEGLDEAGAQQLPGGAFSDPAQHGAELLQGHNVRIEPEASFIFMSCHCVFLQNIDFVDGSLAHKIQYWLRLLF